MASETYTGRTRSESGEYAAGRKSLIYLMGLGGVEPPTSRLSATGDESRKSYTYIKEAGFRPRAAGESINETPLFPPVLRTQRVPALVKRATRVVVAVVGGRRGVLIFRRARA